MSQNPSRINAPLNFRTSDTLITTKVPHYPTKVDTGTQIVPGWNRPNANGLNSNIISSDYNGPNFKARPLKHWRRQLRSYNGSDPCISSLNIWSPSTQNVNKGYGFFFISGSNDGTKAVGGGGNSLIQLIPPLFAPNVAGLWYTTDSGKTWNQSTDHVGINIVNHIYNVSMSSDGTYAVAGINISLLTIFTNGIWYSSNGGQTWRQTTSSTIGHYAYPYICISGDGKIAISGSDRTLIGGSNNYGIYYSSNSGASWNSVNFTNPLYSQLIFENVSISYDGKNAVIIQIKNDLLSPTTEYKIWHSTDYGQTWNTSTTTPPIPTTTFINHISISKYGLRAIAATSGQGLYYSTDGGFSFTQSNISSGNFYYTSLSDNGLKALAAGDNGIWYSSNAGQTWTNGTTLSSYIAVISGDGNKAVAGAGISTANKGLLYSNTSGAYWNQVSTNTTGNFSAVQNINNIFINNNGKKAIAGGYEPPFGSNLNYNGMWYSNCTDYYNYNKFTSNRTVTISELERPGVTVYHYNPACECGDDGGNTYIIANNKFGYETKGNQFSEPQNDVKIQNNGFNTVPTLPYDATQQMINDPANPAYEVLTGVSNTNCINCSPQNNIIKRSIAFNSQAYFADSYAKQQSRCQTYEQNISTNRVNGIQYFNNNYQPVWPDNSPLGSQVVAPVNYTPPRLYSKPCLSQTIYKPNNVAFAKQGAVPGSTRLKKLVSDSVTLNGNSFYSAAAAAAANFGKYQGTNIPGNYYVKIKQVVDSCVGKVPNPPNLIFVNNTLTSITVSWNTPINNSCPILFYTLTFYPILSNTPISITVYPSNNSNNTYTITGLSSNTFYEILITATNGNGTSDINNILNSNTLFDSQIQILLSPSTYTYTYNPSSINVTVTVTSLNPNTPIVLSLINMQDLSGNVINNVAVFLTPTSTNNVYSLVLNNAGSFNVYAQQAGSGIYQNSTATSPTITINRFPTTINFNSPIPTSGTFGTTYILPNPLITWVPPNSPPPGVTVTYSTSDPTVATFTDQNNPSSNFTIHKAGTFTINASTNLTQNYESTSITTSTITINKGTITLSFQTTFITPTNFGDPYIIPGINILNQANNPVNGLTITYSTNNPSIATFTNQNDPSSTSFKIYNPGIFIVSLYSNETDRYYQSSTLSSSNIYVVNVPEITIYNNPKVFPRDGGTSGEVGFIVGIPAGTWPTGFSDFTSVDITSGTITIPINSSSTPIYSNCLNKYLVYGEPGTASSFINGLSSSPGVYIAANIAFSGTSVIANGASSGITLNFSFSGGSGSGVPSSFTFTIVATTAISQGFVYVQHPFITTSTIPYPPPGQSSNGNLTVGWKGIGGANNPSLIQQAWGISANSSISIYPTYSPLIASGSPLPPNHTFYATTSIGTPSTNSYYYYIGIPKIIAPNYSP